MTYVMSDIHGSYEKFKQMLAKIELDEQDVLYILGDIVDIGDQPIELLCDLSMRYNVLPILGEHDYKALHMLTALDKVLEGASADEETMAEIATWISNGGRTTVEGFRALDPDMREGVLDYLADMALYEEIEIRDRRYILVHAGIADFDANVSLDEYLPEDFISTPLDPHRVYYRSAVMVAGHTNTEKYGEAGRIYKTDSAILVDCGADREGGRLGCIRLEDGEEFYV